MNSATATVPATVPVEFTERIIYLMVDLLGMWPQLGAVVSLDGPLHRDRLARALYLLTIAEPVLGCRFVPDTKPPVWQRVDGLEPTALLLEAATDDPEAAADAFVAEPWDVCAGPQVAAALFRGPSGDTLALKLSHVAVDGGAVKEALYMLASIYRTLSEQPDWTPVPNDGRRQPLAEGSLAERFRALRSSQLTMDPSDWHIRGLGGRGRGEYRKASVEAAVFESAIELGRGLGATVNDILLTAYLRAMWRLLGAAPGEQTPCQLSCELRKHLPEGTKTALSNISNMFTVNVSPAACEEFEETLLRVVAATSAWKRAGGAKASALAVPMANALMRRQAIEPMRKAMRKGITESVLQAWRPTLTNIGIIDEDRVDFGSDARPLDAYLLGPISWGGAALTASTFRGRFHLSVGAELDALDEQLVASMVNDTADEIRAWVASRAVHAPTEPMPVLKEA